MTQDRSTCLSGWAIGFRRTNRSHASFCSKSCTGPIILSLALFQRPRRGTTLNRRTTKGKESTTMSHNEGKPIETGQNTSHGNLAPFDLPLDRGIIPNRRPQKARHWVQFPNSVKLASAIAKAFFTHTPVNELDTSNIEPVAHALLFAFRG